MTGSRSARWLDRFKALLAIAIAGLLMAAPAQAQPPRQLGYQGYLTTSGNTPVNATLSITFRLYTGQVAPMAVWTETQTVPVANGVYSVVLGSFTPLPASFAVPYWIGVSVGLDAEMTPRSPLVAVPYALFADAAKCQPGDRLGCYSGPAGTVGVGTCLAGVRVCDSQGVFGTCEGQVTPQTETCNGADDDCDGVADDGLQCGGAIGTACMNPGDCASGFCVDGVCCGSSCTGLCQACSAAAGGGQNGACVNIVAGVDPGNECPGAAVCGGSGTCKQADGMSCMNGVDCLSNLCVGGVCVTAQALGTSCSVSEQCQSGFCADGVCCSTACTGMCQACSMSGMCTNTPAGADPANECGNYLCSGSGSCSTSCTVDFECKSTAYCDVNNTCSAKGANGTACSASNQCLSGVCTAGVCT